jgi:hypothetical protein
MSRRNAPPPPEAAWHWFLAEVDRAVGDLAAGGSAPEPFEKLTLAQFAAAKIAAATHVLLLAMTDDRRVDDLAKLAPQAWHRASWGIFDPLLTVPRIAHRPGADPGHTVLRAMIVKLVTEAVAGGKKQRAAATAVADEMLAQQIAQVPDVKTIERWCRHAIRPGTHLAAAYAWLLPRPWPPSAGTTLTERVRWIGGGGL